MPWFVRLLCIVSSVRLELEISRTYPKRHGIMAGPSWTFINHLPTFRPKIECSNDYEYVKWTASSIGLDLIEVVGTSNEPVQTWRASFAASLRPFSLSTVP